VIDRRRLINGFAFSALGAPLTAARAHAPDKVWRIGYIGIASAGTSPQSDRLLEVFVQALRESGFVEGKNLILERRATEGRTDRSPALVAELIGLPVDVLVLLDIPGVLRAAKETATIPIVMLNASDPVASGLVTSLARPGGNITGLTDFNEDLYPKRLELLQRGRSASAC
jgi:putative ABC transport system substrate-binding protein